MTEWVDPARIRFKISPHNDLSGICGGDWDLERRYPLEEAVKHRSIVQRYAEGRKWEDTDLFREVYAKRIKRESIRTCGTMKDLLAQYYGRVDALFNELERDGFRLERGKKRHSLPVLLIGRGGEIFIGNQGNHRLAMAHVLGLKEFAGEVICRHRLLNSIAA